MHSFLMLPWEVRPYGRGKLTAENTLEIAINHFKKYF